MINNKIDLDIVNDKIAKMPKIKKVAKSKLSKERGVSRDIRPENTIETLQDFLDANEQKWVYLKTIGPKLKKVIQQRFPNGKPMNGYTEKSWNTKKTKNDYHARPSDLEDIGGISLDICKARQSELNKKTSSVLAHGANLGLCYIDVDTAHHDNWIKEILKKYPHWKSLSNVDGKYHIPVKIENLPDSFIGLEGYTENSPRHKCYYNDLVAEKKVSSGIDQHWKIEIFAGGWLYGRKDTKMINGKRGMLKLDWNKFKLFLVLCKKAKNSTKDSATGNKKVIHTFTRKKATEKIIKKFQEFGKLIKSEIWGRTKGKIDEGGGWNAILKCAKQMGIPYEIFDKLSKNYDNYDKENNKKKWDDMKERFLTNYTIDALIRMARGVKDEKFQYTGDYRECDRLCGEMVENNKFQIEIWNKIIEKHKERIGGETENEEILKINDQIEKNTKEQANTHKITDDDSKNSKLTKKERRRELKKEMKDLKELRDLACDADALNTKSTNKKIFNELYNECKIYWENYHFKVKYPSPGYAILEKGQMHFLDTAQMRVMHEAHSIPTKIHAKTQEISNNEFFQVWRKDSSMRTNSKCNFCPNPMQIDCDTFNLYRGLKASRIESEEVPFENIEDTFLRHIHILAGDQPILNPELSLTPYEYLLRYLAHTVQFPGELPMTAILEKGPQGTGKSLFYSQFGRKIIGKEYTLTTAHLKDIVGKFHQIQQKIFVVMDEIGGKAGFAEKEKLKNIISDPVVSWEQKYKDMMQINNCARFIFTSNGSTPVAIELQDRRFVVFLCSSKAKNLPEKERNEYFNKLNAAFEDPRYVKTFYNYLKNFDLTLPERLQSNGSKIQYKPKNNRPFTKAYCDIQSVHIPTPYYFFKSLVPYFGIDLTGEPEEIMKKKKDTRELCNKIQTFTRSQVWEDYQEYLTHIGKDKEKEFSDATKFWRRIGAWCDNEGWDVGIERFKNKSNENSIRINPIKIRELLEEYAHLLQI